MSNSSSLFQGSTVVPGARENAAQERWGKLMTLVRRKTPTRSTSENDITEITRGGQPGSTSRVAIENEAHSISASMTRAFPTASSNTKESPFLLLPGELRNKVYDMLIPSNDIDIFTVHTTSEEGTCAFLHASIYRICRRIRAEAVSYLCHKRRFHIFKENGMRIFLNAIGPSGRAALYDVTYVVTPFEDLYPDWLPLLLQAKQLRIFTLDISRILMLKRKSPKYNRRGAIKVPWSTLKDIRSAVESIKGAEFRWTAGKGVLQSRTQPVCDLGFVTQASLYLDIFDPEV